MKMKTGLKNKIGKQEVNVTVCYYLLENDTERYVFYFYDPMYREPIDKWIYYLENGKNKEFRDAFFAYLKEHNYKVNRPAILCMCNKDTKVSRIKLPKTLGFAFKYKKIIEADLEDKFGKDVQKNFYINNQVDGLEEKNAEKKERRNRKNAALEKKKLVKLERQLDEREKEKKFKAPYSYTKTEKFVNAYSLIGSYLIAAFSFFIILYFSKQPLITSLATAFVVICLLFLVVLFVLDVLKQKKSRVDSSKKRKFLVKDYANAILIVWSLGLVVFSEFILLTLNSGELSYVSRNLYVLVCSLFIIFAVLWVDFKNKHNSKTYLPLHEFFSSLKREPQVDEIKKEEEELFFDGVTPKNLFNLSNEKHKLFKYKGDKAVISFRQLLVSQYSYKSASFTMKNLGLKVKEIRTLPSLINQFHLRYAKGVNEIVVYNEADFTLFVGIVNDKIVDSVFIKGSEKSKSKDNPKTYHLQSFYNVFSSLLWSCQREAIRMDRVLYFANSPKKIEQIKQNNIFGLPYSIVKSTDALYGKSSKSIKEQLKAAFTLLETVVAFSVFILVGLLVATLLISISNMNEFSRDQSKANVYLNNVREALRVDPSNDTFEDLTTYKLEVGESAKECTYYVNYAFDVFAPSTTKGDNSYVVVANIQKIDYESKSYSTYVFTIKSIKRTTNNRNLVSETKIEVTK